MSTRAEGFGYIGLSRSLDDFYHERIVAASTVFGLNEVGKYYNEEIDENKLKDYIQKVKDYNQNVVTYWAHNSKELYNKFIQLMKDESLSTDKYPVVLVEGSLNTNDLKPTDVDLNNNKGNYHIRGYDVSFNNEDSEYYKDNYYAQTISPYEEVLMYI